MSRLAEVISNGWTYSRQSILAGSAEQRATARRHIARRLALEWLSRSRPVITFERNGFRWTGPSHCTITRTIFIDGQHQDVHIGALKKWIDPAKPVIVNVGANIGDTALPLSKTGKRVIAIEPNPETIARLQENVRNNGLAEKITCCGCAIAAAAGTAELVIANQPGNAELMGPNGAVGFDGVDQRRNVVSVPTRPLDSLLESLQVAPDQVALVWSDTQGFESEVIASGTALWTHGTPLWVEVWPKGLNCHGGTARFIDLCRQYFPRFSSARHPGMEPAPIAELESFVAGLQGDASSDILLLPAR